MWCVLIAKGFFENCREFCAWRRKQNNTQRTRMWRQKEYIYIYIYIYTEENPSATKVKSSGTFLRQGQSSWDHWNEKIQYMMPLPELGT